MDPEQDVRKVEELWFDDANVIFQAGNLQFRVHRGILSARSPIFKDMFSVPQPELRLLPFEDGTLKPEVIRLPDDGQEVHYFFQAIFDSSFFEPPPSPTAIEILAAILRLSHKYEVKYLLRRAVAHLNLIFPTDLETFAASLVSTNDYDLHLRRIGVKLSMLRLIQPAYAASIHWILPSLFRRAVCVGIGDLFGSSEWRALPVQMQETFHTFRDVFRSERESHLFITAKFPGQPHRCTDVEKCLKAMQRIVAAPQAPLYLDVSHIRWLLGTDPRSTIEKCFCSACAKGLIDVYERFAKLRWSAYPTTLRLSDWDTLKKEKNDFSANAGH